MSEVVEVSLGGENVAVVIEGGNMAAGAAVVFQDLNEAAARAEQAASDAEAAAAGIPAMVTNKADIDGGNIPPSDAEDFRSAILASPRDVVTAIDGTNSQVRQVTSKLLDIVNARDAFGFDLTRDVDAKDSLESLFAEKAASGGSVTLPLGDIYVSSLNIPAGVKVVGASPRPGENDANRIQNRYGTTLWLDPGGTITLQNMAQLSGVQILNPELKFVTVTNGVPDLTEAQAMGTAPIPGWPYNGGYGGVAQFSGKAITIAGDDTLVSNVLAVGFEYAYFSSSFVPPRPILPGPSRQIIDGLWFDCTNGIDISDCWDVAKITRCHGWNFFTGHTGFSWSAIIRDGIGFNLHDKCDGAQLIGNFDIGHKIGYRFKNVFGIQCVSCTGDGVQPFDQGPDHYGFLTEGTINGVYFNNCQADGKWHGFVFNHTAGAIGAGMVQTGTTAGGAYVFGPGSCGGISNLVIAASFNDNILVKSGIRDWCVGQVTGYYMVSNGVGNNLFHFEDPNDEKKIQRGAANLDSWSVTNDPMGPSFRTLKAGSHMENQVWLTGSAAAGSGQPNAGFSAIYASGGDTNVSLDLIAKGNDASSQVRFIKGSASTRDLIGRVVADSGAHASFLLWGRGSGVSISPEGPGANYGLFLNAKGSGKITSVGPSEFQNGTAANNPLSVGGITFEYASDTQLRVKMRGTDNVIRFATLTLS